MYKKNLKSNLQSIYVYLGPARTQHFSIIIDTEKYHNKHVHTAQCMFKSITLTTLNLK